MKWRLRRSRLLAALASIDHAIARETPRDAGEARDKLITWTSRNINRLERGAMIVLVWRTLSLSAERFSRRWRLSDTDIAASARRSNELLGEDTRREYSRERVLLCNWSRYHRVVVARPTHARNGRCDIWSTGRLSVSTAWRKSESPLMGHAWLIIARFARAVPLEKSNTKKRTRSRAAPVLAAMAFNRRKRCPPRDINYSAIANHRCARATIQLI